ncbi:nicotinate-nucleotide adenylyltransferase [Aestuariibacter halophilus]|uniref:Probable nicotinate-nucleotide adenylyltransferase n=1 Tax=Fluctibacter halophilus TaxID=226011 RepID=A0ABS8G9C6_9ALTE|nr:nicotinate-nucleotide adenylyltransferase [Aestuariibacter halophilus]MCC2615811.1 nicotinate-nucleotide adenylyltransferase [Aestuariibacter halophilus]
MTFNPTSPLGILGGTFDPIHNGHLGPVQEAAQRIGLSGVTLLPCHIPPHRATPSVSAEQRLEMARLACLDWPFFSVDDRELRRDTPSYTVDTLHQLRAESAQRPLCFFIGMDSWLSFDQWVRWQEILTLCHLVVCQRPGYPEKPSNALQEALSQRQTEHPSALLERPCGHIFFAPSTRVDISATTLRQRLAAGEDAKTWLPARVLNYIQQHHLYGID